MCHGPLGCYFDGYLNGIPVNSTSTSNYFNKSVFTVEIGLTGGTLWGKFREELCQFLNYQGYPGCWVIFKSHQVYENDKKRAIKWFN